jgi:hypothetical protein
LRGVSGEFFQSAIHNRPSTIPSIGPIPIVKLRGGADIAPELAGGAYVPTLFVGMYATQGRYNVRVSKLKHYYALNHLHYLTSSIPQGDRARLFDSERLGKQWVATFGELRRELELNYLHKSPVKRGPVKHPGDWPWSRRGGEVLFLESRYDLGHGQNAVMASTYRGPHTSRQKPSGRMRHPRER